MRAGFWQKSGSENITGDFGAVKTAGIYSRQEFTNSRPGPAYQLCEWQYAVLEN